MTAARMCGQIIPHRYGSSSNSPMNSLLSPHYSLLFSLPHSSHSLTDVFISKHFVRHPHMTCGYEVEQRQTSEDGLNGKIMALLISSAEVLISSNEFIITSISRMAESLSINIMIRYYYVWAFSSLSLLFPLHSIHTELSMLLVARGQCAGRRQHNKFMLYICCLWRWRSCERGIGKRSTGKMRNGIVTAEHIFRDFLYDNSGTHCTNYE